MFCQNLFRGQAMVVAVAIGLSATSPAGQSLDYEFVPVNSPGNASDWTGFGSVSGTYGIGRYEVTISQYNVFLNAVAKSDPYGLYNTSMGATASVAGIARTGTAGGYEYTVVGPAGVNPAGARSAGNRPVTYVSWFDAARFVNWMQNGQSSGSTEDGTYKLVTSAITSAVRRNHQNEYTTSQQTGLSVGDQVAVQGLTGDGFNITGVVSSLPTQTSFTLSVSGIYSDADASGTGVLTASSATRSSSSKFWIPSEDEWYKAAFFDPAIGGGSGGYWTYATRSNTPPGNAIGGLPNQVNYRAYAGPQTGIVDDTIYSVTQSATFHTDQNYLTDAGAYTSSQSAFGTYDQNGNAAEWNEAIPVFSGWPPGSARGVRGGWWSIYFDSNLRSNVRDGFDPLTESANIGFRLATSVVVPEPSTLFSVAAAVACVGISVWWQRKRA